MNGIQAFRIATSLYWWVPKISIVAIVMNQEGIIIAVCETIKNCMQDLLSRNKLFETHDLHVPRNFDVQKAAEPLPSRDLSRYIYKYDHQVCTSQGFANDCQRRCRTHVLERNFSLENGRNERMHATQESETLHLVQLLTSPQIRDEKYIIKRSKSMSCQNPWDKAKISSSVWFKLQYTHSGN